MSLARPPRALLLALLGTLLLVAPPLAVPGDRALAQQSPDAPELDVAITLDRDTATLGEHVTLTVAVRHADDVLVTIEAPGAIEALRLLSTADDPPVASEAGEGSTTTSRFVFAAFGIGAFDFGAVRVAWLRADGSDGAVAVAAPAFEVTSVLAPGETDLRPLKPQATVGGAPPALARPIVGGSVAALAAVALAALTLWLRRRRAVEAVYVPPSLETEREARGRLDALARSDPLGTRDYQTYYGTISLIVRRYLEARFGFRATALTTRELEERMAAMGFERFQALLVGRVLDRCDAAVFARRYPDPVSADQDLTAAYEIVEISRPRGRAELTVVR